MCSNPEANIMEHESLKRAAGYKLISLLFGTPWLLKDSVGDLNQLPCDLEQLKKIIADVDKDSLKQEFGSIFGHSLNSEFPLYEIMYGKDNVFQQSSELADISGFYQAFGLNPAANQERADHIATEAEFMSFLCMQEYLSEDDKKELVRETQKKFLHDHLGRWAPTLAGKLKLHCSSQLYKEAAEYLEKFILSEFALLSITPKRYRDIDVRQKTEVPLSSCFSCPSSNECSFDTVGDLEEEIR